jgi:hypothetical protein
MHQIVALIPEIRPAAIIVDQVVLQCCGRLRIHAEDLP